MLVVFVLFLLIPLHEANLSYEQPNGSYFQKCVSDIIKKYFHKDTELLMLDMNTKYEEIVKIVHHIERNTIYLRTSNSGSLTPSPSDGYFSYFIAAENYTDLLNNLPALSKEKYWRPNARFLIIISEIRNTSLGKIFDLLLAHHIVNVLVMIQSADPDLYTYNPFENYRCGQRYDRIIEYGKCSMSQQNLYPYKFATGLRNCTFKVACPHWPPYTIDPAKDNGFPLPAIEEMVLKELGKLEHFHIEVAYSNDAEEFSTIKNDVVANGPLYLLQKREVQIMAGGMLLTYPRAKALDYIWAHLAFTDEISYQVKRATFVAMWEYTYLQFDAIVWTVLALAFLAFLLIFIVLVRPSDKGRIALDMFGSLLLASRTIRGNFFTRYLFIQWVLFAYIVNLYYVSNLVSLTTNPVTYHQVSDEKGLLENNMQPCVSRVIKDYLASVDVDESIWRNNRKGCEKLLESIRTVSKSYKLYTVVIRSLYKYNKYSFADEWGDPTIYTFKKPLAKAIYAIYLYKGFPMIDKLHIQTLRLRENGLVDLYLQLLYRERNQRYHFYSTKKQNYTIVPWHILLFGYLLSVIVFLFEIIVKKFLYKRGPILSNSVVGISPPIQFLK